MSLGRGARNDIRILDTEVSRVHAHFCREDDAFLVSDRDSSNGTFVNGAPVRTRKLVNGDQIQIGRSVLLFTESQPEGDSSRVSERIDYLGKNGSDDRSSIVDEVGQDQGQKLLQRSVAADPGTRDMAQTLANLQALYGISEVAVSSAVSLEQSLKRILDLAIDTVGADRACMLITDSQSGVMEPQAICYRHGVDASAKMPVSRSIVDYVVANGQGVRTSDARSDRRFEGGQSILQAGIREAMCVPMHGHYELMGVIYLDTTTSPEQVILDGGVVSKFSEEQLRLLVAIGRQSALAIENNRYQQAFVKAERLAAMGQTIATLSHHIKNILQGVRGGSYLIDMGLKDHNEDLVGKGWTIVEKNQNKIYDLVMDMLTFSTERQPALQVASLNETVRDVFELMQARAQELKVAFDCELTTDLPETTYDPEGIHRAVLNIVTNAIDAVEGTDGAAVAISTGYDEESCEMFIIVADNGPGIPEEQLKQIFNIFESTKGARGTGLGLAVSQKILREHGGDIVVESNAGHGCRFRLAWPHLEDDNHVIGGETMV